MYPEDAQKSGVYTRQDMLWWGVFLLVAGGVLGAGIMRFAVMPQVDAGRHSTEPLPVFGQVSDFKLTDSSGDEISREDLEGRVWIADFFFTSCASICPRMSERLVELQAELSDLEEVTLVSISVDPERDTPERLRRYAKKYGADPIVWWFLTGEMSTIRRLSEESFRLGLQQTPEGKEAPGVHEVLHSSKFVLLDRRSRIRGYYDGLSKETVGVLAEDVRRLLRE